MCRHLKMQNGRHDHQGDAPPQSGILRVSRRASKAKAAASTSLSLWLSDLGLRDLDPHGNTFGLEGGRGRSSIDEHRFFCPP